MRQIFTDLSGAPGHFHRDTPWPEPGQWDLGFRLTSYPIAFEFFTRCSFQLFLVCLVGYGYAIIGSCSSYEDVNRKKTIPPISTVIQLH